jgi:phosphoglycerate dehydrogenase-like enzyme
MRVIFCGSGWLPIVGALRARVPENVEVVARDFSRSFEEQLADVEVIIPSNAKFGREQIGAAKVLRLIQQSAVGFDGIDIEAAKACSIPVCNAPGTNAQSAAEATVFLMLALARRARTAMRLFEIPVIGEPLGVELAGKRLCLIGRGGQGQRVAAIASAFGMEVAILHSESTREELLAVLTESDFVSIHCPLSERTRGMFDDEAFARMKPGAHLINVSRGPIVDRGALERALVRLGGVGLDVFWREPWDPADPLFADPKVVALPHVAGSTEEAFGRIADVIVENIRRLDTGEPLLHRLV